MKIHPTALVHPKAELADDVSVGPYAVVEEGVVVGAGTKIGSHVYLAKGTVIGEDCKIFHGAVLGMPPQDLKFTGGDTSLRIGDRTVIREYATIHRGSHAKGETVVGSDCFIMAYAHIAHDCFLEDHVILTNMVQLAGHVTVERYAYLGGMVPVHQFVRIGQHCMVGGGYRVPKDVPPFVLAAGEPLRPVRLNIVGLRRRGFAEETIKVLHRAFKIFFRSGLNTSQALRRAKEELPSIPEVEALLNFIEHSERGIIK
ncbi:MAG: acyl-[acyl-carrier-protein]--UDP-N-acetylglucosamine O-acyltransferase [Candidatus Latescibacterota bacterium]|nr:MAG: acyl-[acyl-carrier-protein]--UDP-N-acetylglucosamine O-acyltransferase [Candidatus Latescibacterota bacterium]RKY72994.1 MAG: acyl-[acyl-carrier-protein]--UDP-N-acetylglucosamine O-acyltransferase [Candidatus Latescibacterota bacterium]